MTRGRRPTRGGLARRTGLDDRVGALRVRLDFDGDDGITFRRAGGEVPSSQSSGLLKHGARVSDPRELDGPICPPSAYY
jgi:hypothetical protein